VDKKGVDLDKGLIGSEPPVIDQPQIPFQPPRKLTALSRRLLAHESSEGMKKQALLNPYWLGP
jgi:hypothetical protein